MPTFSPAPGVSLVKLDASSNVGIYNSSGTEVAYFDGNGNLVILGSTVPAGTLSYYGSGSSSSMRVNAPSGGSVLMQIAGNSNYQFLATGVARFANIASAGLGVPAIYAAGAQTLYTNVAPTTLSYTPPATAGIYRVSAYLNIITGTTLTFKIKITYTDPGGNAVTDVPDFEQQNSTTLLAGGPTANTTGRFSFSWPIAINNGAAAITVADNTGTYTTGTYYWTPFVEQIA